MSYLKDKKIGEFIGNGEVVEQIKKSVFNKEGGSFILYGASGVGKATYAYMMSEYILNDFVVPSRPITGQIYNLSHPDFLVIDGEDQENGTIGIDEIRKVQSFAMLSAGQSKHKVIIIDKADNLNRNAANALLKILEEPPRKTFIFIISDVLGRMLPTLRSRCIKFRFRALTFSEFNTLVEGGDELLYRITQGSVKLAKALSNCDDITLYADVMESFRNKNKDFNKVLEIAERASKSDTVWVIVQKIILHYMVETIKTNTTGEKLDKQLEYYAQVKDLFAQAEVFNLDKKAVIVSILR